MMFKNKFPKVSALAEKPAAAVTETDITAATEELQAAGINSVVLVSGTELSAANETLTTDLAAQVARVTELATQVNTLEGTIATLTTDRDKFKADAEKFGKQPGAMGTNPVKTEGDKGDDKEKQASTSIHPASAHQTEINNNY